MEPAALRPVRALHRPRPVAQRLPQLPRQQGALPAQHRRVMQRRLAALGAGALLVGVLAGCTGDEPREAAAEPSSEPTRQTSSAPATEEPSNDETALEG